MSIINVLICFAALALSGLSFILLVHRYLVANPNQAPSVDDGYYTEDLLEIASPISPLPVNNGGCMFVPEVGVITAARLKTQPAIYVIQFGTCYTFQDDVGGYELVIANTVLGTEKYAAIGDILFLSTPYNVKMGLMAADDSVSQFIELDRAGRQVSTISELNLRTGTFYRLTYLGIVDGFKTVGVQVARMRDPTGNTTQ